MYTENTENEIIIAIIITDLKQVASLSSNYFVAVAKNLTKKLVKQITNIKTILKTQMNKVYTLLK